MHVIAKGCRRAKEFTTRLCTKDKHEMSESPEPRFNPPTQGWPHFRGGFVLPVVHMWSGHNTWTEVALTRPPLALYCAPLHSVPNNINATLEYVQIISRGAGLYGIYRPEAV